MFTCHSFPAAGWKSLEDTQTQTWLFSLFFHMESVCLLITFVSVHWTSLVNTFCNLISFIIAKDFIIHLMEKDPITRYTCDQALQHPW